MFDEIYKALPPWGQGLLTLIVVGIGAGATIAGLRKRVEEKPLPPMPSGSMHGRSDIPIWLMMGPAHEVIQTVHDMAETQRNILAELQRISAASMDSSKELDRLNQGQEYTHHLLEEILRYNNMTLPPSSPMKPRGRG